MARDEEDGCSKELMPELWQEIGKRLGNHVDIELFRSTCTSWRCLLPSPFPSVFPLRVPSPPCLAATSRLFHVIVQHTGYLISSENNTNPVFLVFQNKGNRVFSPFRLFSPESNDKKSWSWPQKLDLGQLPVKFLFKAYYLHHSFDSVNNGRIVKPSLVQKVVLISYFSHSNHCPSINPEFAVAKQGNDLAVVALLPNGQLALHLTLGNDWKLISHSPAANYKFDDIVSYGGKLWGVDIDGGAFVLEDYVSLKMTKVAATPITFIDGKSYVCNAKTFERSPVISPFYPKGIDMSFDASFDHYDDDSCFKGRKRLVEASGKLYMLFPCRLLNDPLNQIKVFELNPKNEWEEVKSIGNHCFFIGPGFAFSMTDTKELAGHFWGDCIFLSGVSFCRSVEANTDYPLFREMLEPGPTIGVYSLVDNKFRKMSPEDYAPIFCTRLPSSLNPKDVPPSREEMINRATKRGREMMSKARWYRECC